GFPARNLRRLPESCGAPVRSPSGRNRNRKQRIESGDLRRQRNTAMSNPEEILDQLTVLSHHLGDPERDLAILGESNTSARLDDETFYVKASGQHLGTITPSGFCAVNFSRVLPVFDGPDLSDAEVRRILLECKADDASEVLPSVETFLHAFLLTLPNMNFVG